MSWVEITNECVVGFIQMEYEDVCMMGSKLIQNRMELKKWQSL